MTILLSLFSYTSCNLIHKLINSLYRSDHLVLALHSELKFIISLHVQQAWRLWSEKRPLELIHESLGDSLTLTDVLKVIHVGLLCVQERPEDRPSMSRVVLMLNGERPMPKPKQPAFYPHQESSSSSKCEFSSSNGISISLEAR